MITNIVDERNQKYKFKNINAVVEATWHDNECKNADKVVSKRGPDYEQKEHISLTEAIKWANSFKSSVTLYIYDKNDGIY